MPASAISPDGAQNSAHDRALFLNLTPAKSIASRQKPHYVSPYHTKVLCNASVSHNAKENDSIVMSNGLMPSPQK